jgi:hypothetical protein
MLNAGCAVRAPVSFLESHSKLTLDEAQSRLQQATKPIDRTITYIQISDILLRHIRTSVPLKDTDAVSDWMAQYREAITAAQQTIVASGRDAQAYPQGYMDLEMVLRQHIRWLGDWRGGLIDQERRPIDETMDIAVAIRQQMLDLLFPVEKRDLR